MIEMSAKNIMKILALTNLSGYLFCQLEALAMPERASKFTAKNIRHTPTEARQLMRTIMR